MKRKTDDNKILEMLKEGKNQKEIAEYFNVSPVAIHKRIKRLLPSEPPESFNNLTEKEQRFCIEVVKGKTQTQAVMNSFDVTSRESAKVIGSQLMDKIDIQTAINDLMQYHGISRSYRVKRLADHINNRDPHVSLKALDQSWKLSGDYIEKHMNLNLNADIRVFDMSEYE
jgi:predicted transcriptional regulator